MNKLHSIIKQKRKSLGGIDLGILKMGGKSTLAEQLLIKIGA